MKIFSLMSIVTLLASGFLRAEIPEEFLIRDVRGWINGQIEESEAWDDSLSGGYLFRFSADVWGDSRPEEFLANSSGFSHGATWLVFSGDRKIGWLTLSAYEFLVIREGDISIFPSGGTFGGVTGMLIQTWDESGIKRESREVHQEEFGEYLKDWKARGQVIRPQLEMLRLVDYLQGSREWEPVDLWAEEVEFRGNTGAIVLKRDIERLQALNLRPEAALEMFEKMRETEEPSASGKAGASGLDKPMDAGSCPAAEQDALSDGPANGPGSWPWLAAALAVIAFAVALMLASRFRTPRG